MPLSCSNDVGERDAEDEVSALTSLAETSMQIHVIEGGSERERVGERKRERRGMWLISLESESDLPQNQFS